VCTAAKLRLLPATMSVVMGLVQVPKGATFFCEAMFGWSMVGGQVIMSQRLKFTEKGGI
jgi:hypothetical protein